MSAPESSDVVVCAAAGAVALERDAWQKPVQSSAISERGRAQAAEETVKQVWLDLLATAHARQLGRRPSGRVFSRMRHSLMGGKPESGF